MTMHVNFNLKCVLLFNLYRLSPTQSKYGNKHSFFKHTNTTRIGMSGNTECTRP